MANDWRITKLLQSELAELINNKQWKSDQVTALTYSVYVILLKLSHLLPCNIRSVPLVQFNHDSINATFDKSP